MRAHWNRTKFLTKRTKETKNREPGLKKRPDANMIFSSFVLFVSFVVISPISIDDGFWIKYQQGETVHKL